MYKLGYKYYTTIDLIYSEIKKVLKYNQEPQKITLKKKTRFP